VLLDENQTEQLNTAIESALDKVYEHDIYLIEQKVHERTIVSRFCIYFQHELNLTTFASNNLDSEYNRYDTEPKRTSNFTKGTYPDIILHKRGSNDANVLVVEFKTSWNKNTAKDIQKLKDYTNQQGKYKYGIGCSIVLNQNRADVKTTLIKNGEVSND